MAYKNLAHAGLILSLVLIPAQGLGQPEKLYVPSHEPDMRMECAVITMTPKEFGSKDMERSPPFRLFVEIYFEDSISRFSDNFGVTNYDLPITEIAKQKEYREKLITAKRGGLIATINMHFKDIFISDIDNGQIRKFIGGRDCRIDTQG